MVLTPLSYDELIEKGISAPVARFITAKTHPIEDFNIFVRPLGGPDRMGGWDYHVPPGVEDVVGLWEDNADAYCRWRRRGRVEFVLLFHDDPEHELLAWTEQGLLAHLVRQYLEVYDGPEGGELAFVRYLGFRHMDKLEAFFDKWREGSGGDWEEAFRDELGRLSSGETGIKPCP